MTPAERAAKIAELRAEADRLEREGAFIDSILPPLTLEWCDEIWRSCPRGMEVASAIKWVIEQDRARISIKTPDAHKPTGAELVGKVCEFSDDGKRWHLGGCDGFDPDDPAFPFHREGGCWWKYARLAKEQP